MDQRTPILQSFSETKRKTNKYVYILTFFSTIGGFLFGYDTGVISGAMIILKKRFMLDNIWQEMLVAITVGFAAVFSLLGGVFNNWSGRRVVILTASLIFLVGSVLLAVAYNKYMLLVGRAIVGAGIGLASMTVPMYIAEVAPAHVRGRLVVINNVFITGGQFVASCVDGFFSNDEINGWRYMLGLAAIPAFIQLVGFLFLPESPRWLMEKKKYDKAVSSLQKVHSDRHGFQNRTNWKPNFQKPFLALLYIFSKAFLHLILPLTSMSIAFSIDLALRCFLGLIIGDDVAAQKEFEMLRTFVEEEKQAQRSGGLCQVLRNRSVRRALIVGCGLQMFQQLAGINTVMYYSATIVQMSGVQDDSLAIWLAAATAFVNFIFTFVGLWLVERMGRRLLTLLSIAGVTLSLFFLSTGFYLASVHSPPVSYNISSKFDNSLCCYSSCSACIESYDCGYCYMPKGKWEVYNATCLPLNATNNQLSTFGPCHEKHNAGPYFASNYCPTDFSWMALAGMILYLAFFAPGMGPMPWTINSEIYPQWARSTGNALSTTTNWMFNVIVSLTFLDITRAFTTQGAFLFYGLLSFAGFAFILLFLPETKGKPLEEVERLFESHFVVCCRKESTGSYHVILNQPPPQDESDGEDTLFSK